MPARIQILSDVVANQIAAGEVVDRPASVLKELMENALDAGATQIDVDIQAGGIKRIAVSDNGCGMDRDDALLSVERHATSKIREAEDIANLATLGFRGEALAAIASVSRFRLVTRPAGAQSGTELTLAGGRLGDVREAGAPPGTTFEVRDLFFNMPARRKFLRAPETEAGHLRLAFLTQALGHPETGMNLRAEGRTLYSLAGGASLADRIRDLFGAEYLSRLRPVSHTAGSVAVSGFAGVPEAARLDRGEQYLFINGRPATAPSLARALREGYHTLLASDRNPVLFLFLKVPADRVDVNVHPTKREVRFRDHNEVRDAVIGALRRALAFDGAALLAAAAAAPPPPPAGPPRYGAAFPIADLPPARAFRYPRLPQSPGPGESAGASFPIQDQTPGPTPAAEAGRSPWDWCRILGQVGSLYVVLETADGLVLLDPHAAHERVLFERFMKALAAGNVESQNLLVPETVNLPPAYGQACRGHIELLRRLGFGLAEFGGDTVAVDALPVLFGDVSAARLLPDILSELEAAGSGPSRARWSEERLAEAACKSAVKQRDRLTLAEIEKLVLDLAAADMPYTCPHGRPTMIWLSFPELHRRFGRT
ncbi:MAG: DNA mismatch repair endonuclease MutL [Kiritimatiellia bacterium]